MKRPITFLTFFAPGLMLIVAGIWSDADPMASAPIFHFYIVTFATSAAAVVSMLLSAALKSFARPRHMLASLAFGLMSVLFFSHGLPTPGALTNQFHPALQWSAWLTLFAGGLMFGLAGLDGDQRAPSWLRVRLIAAIALVALILYLAMILFVPEWLAATDARARPWHARLVFISTGALWIFASLRLWLIWKATGKPVDGVLTFVAVWMAQATISLHQFPVWKLSWWLYHFILLVAALATFVFLAIEYEHARRFRLLRYYIAVSLIATVGLALVSSYLFAEYARRTLEREKKSAALQYADALISEIASGLPQETSPSRAPAVYAERLSTRPFEALFIYDRYGNLSFSASHGETELGPGELYGNQGPKPARVAQLSGSEEEYSAQSKEESYLEQALSGETIAAIFEPAEPPEIYSPDEPVHMVGTFAPFFSADDQDPAGALALVKETPELGQAILRARTTGLLAAVLTMGGLFAALLLVVRRADGIISARTSELANAYSELRRSERMREDLTLMTIHDLRNPLTAISASLGLLARTSGKAERAMRERFLDATGSAVQRMSDLLDDILALSKIEAGELKPQLSPVQLGDLLASRLKSFSAQAVVERKRLAHDCPEDLCLPVDGELVGRVLDNLVNNAFKHTDAGGNITVFAQLDHGGVRLTVRDDGEGVPDGEKERIFDKYAQVSGDNGRPYRAGTGLGLAFCRFVVEAHDGRIWVEDAPGGGSDFIIRLPQGRRAET